MTKPRPKYWSSYSDTRVWHEVRRPVLHAVLMHLGALWTTTAHLLPQEQEGDELMATVRWLETTSAGVSF